jgi:hypothetical protein
MMVSRCVLLTVVGCLVASGARAAETFDPGTVVPRAEMTEFCQRAVAAKYEVELEAITTDPPIEREGKLLVLGTVGSDDSDRDAGFDCRFEQNGAYIGILGAPAD